MAEQPGQLMRIGEISAHNIAAALSLGEDKVLEIERAIKDEIDAVTSHFTLAFADISTQHEVEVMKIKKDADAYKEKLEAEWDEFTSAFSYVEANKLKVGIATACVLLAGLVLGHLV